MANSEAGRGRGRRSALACVLCALAAGGLPRATGAAPDAATTAAAGTGGATGAKRQVLRSFPAGPYTYELALEDCSASARPDLSGGSVCVFAVRLFRARSELDRVALFPPSCGPAGATTVTRRLGADRAAAAWATSDEHCDTEIAARTVDLGAAAKGLLVTELAGFEYRYRNHALYLPKDDKLEVAWSYQEDTGAAHRTTVSVIPGANANANTNDLAFVEVVRTERGEASAVRAERLRLDPASGKIASSPLPDASAPLFILHGAGLKSIGEARAARRDCPEDFDVLRAKFFPGLRLPKFFLGAVLPLRADADDAAKALAACSDASKVGVVERTAIKERPNASHH